MKPQKIPKTDSIEELASFWDGHDLTDFEAELEEVTEPVFSRTATDVVHVRLAPQERAAIDKLAKARGIGRASLIHEWITQKLGHAH